MTESVMDVINSLASLQEVDLKIDELTRKKTASPKAVKEMELKIISEKKKIVIKNEEIAEIEKKKRQAEGVVQLNNERLKKNNIKINDIKSNDEYAAINKENEHLIKNTEEIEVGILSLISEIEKLTKETTNIQNLVSEMEAKVETEKGKLSVSNDHLDKDLQIFSTTRVELANKVNKKYLSLYERIRKSRFGIGVVPVIQGSCKGCNMMIPPQLNNQVIKGEDIYQCPHCNRMIFHKKLEQ